MLNFRRVNFELIQNSDIRVTTEGVTIETQRQSDEYMYLYTSSDEKNFEFLVRQDLGLSYDDSSKIKFLITLSCLWIEMEHLSNHFRKRL